MNMLEKLLFIFLFLGSFCCNYVISIDFDIDNLIVFEGSEEYSDSDVSSDDTVISEGEALCSSDNCRACIFDFVPTGWINNQEDKVGVEPGMVVIINGTSSSGKSSVARELIRRMDGPYKCWDLMALDDYDTSDIDAFGESCYEEEEEKYPNYSLGEENSFFCRNIIDSALSGKNVICDTVLYARENERDREDYLGCFVERLRKNGIKYVSVLVYCPLNKLEERVTKRNRLAQVLHTPGETRSPYQFAYQFASLYHCESDVCFSPVVFSSDLGTLSSVDVQRVCSTPLFYEHCDGETGVARVEHRLITGLGLTPSPRDEVVAPSPVSPAVKHDYVVCNQGLGNKINRRCAQEIYSFLIQTFLNEDEE
jgi:deoxyadenosine/deoxycytidine kinase